MGLWLQVLSTGANSRRVKAVLEEVKDSDGQIILFIDELHTIVGAGKTDGAMDAGNMLKPMLARGELTVSVPQLWMSTVSILRRMQHLRDVSSLLW